MICRAVRNLSLVVALAFGGLAVAAPDPTLHDVYEASRSGHADEAQRMMRQVLQDHPGSAKAHYVAAEVDARAGDVIHARQELATAESLDSHLSFAKPEAVQALRRELDSTKGSTGLLAASHAGTSLPWGTILLVVLAAGALWWAWRRRSATANAVSAPYPGAMPVSGAMGGGPMGYGGTAPTPGSGILGSLASGVAVGAGVVAGEELVRHLIQPGHPADGGIGSVQAAELPQNQDMGGSDFGVNDADSWDSGGGDDWS